MKKSFFASLLILAVVVFGAAVAPVSAAEPKTAETADSRFEGAKAYYIENMIVGVTIGRKISGGEALSAEQIEAVRKTSRQWLEEELIPFMKQNDVLDEWVTMQFDKDIRELNRKAAEAQSMDDFVKMAKEGAALIKIRYPNSFAKYTSPECVMVMQHLQGRIMRAMMK